MVCSRAIQCEFPLLARAVLVVDPSDTIRSIAAREVRWRDGMAV